MFEFIIQLLVYLGYSFFDWCINNIIHLTLTKMLIGSNLIRKTNDRRTGYGLF